MSEIKEIVEKYNLIRNRFSSLEQTVSMLQLQKSDLEMELQLTQDRERALIDKIKTETGEVPDYYKIMLALNEQGSTRPTEA